jgi:hypothetical protein
MGYKHALTDYDLQRFTEVDFTQHVGLAAVFSEAGSEAHYRSRACISRVSLIFEKQVIGRPAVYVDVPSKSGETAELQSLNPA